MKTQLLTIALAFISVNVLAQITVTDSDLINVGDLIYTAYDNNPSTLIAVGNSGTGQAWDFSSLQTLSVDTESYISPIGTQYEASYPNANLALNTNGTISYFNLSSSGVYAHGINDTVFNVPALFLPLALTYGLSTTDGPIIVLEEEITGPLLDAALPSVTVASLTNNIANRADTALIQVTNTSEFSVSASGSITTPLGVYDVLRLKEKKETSSVLNIFCSDTLTQMGMWFNNIPFSSIPMLAGFSNEEQQVTYSWITNDTTVSYLVASVDVDSFNIVKNASYQTIPIANSISHNSLSDINIYPIPTTYNLTVEAENNELIILNLLDVNGKLIISKQCTNSTTLDLSKIAKGIYYLNLNTTHAKLTKKIVKQ
jgi:hypothetical protein